MTNAIERLRVILTAAVTWLVAIAAVLAIVAEEIADAFGADFPALVWIARVAVVIGVAIAIIRRVTPVLPEARGVVNYTTPMTERERILLTPSHPSNTWTNPPP